MAYTAPGANGSANADRVASLADAEDRICPAQSFMA